MPVLILARPAGLARHFVPVPHSLALKLRICSFLFTHCRTGSRPCVRRINKIGITPI